MVESVGKRPTSRLGEAAAGLMIAMVIFAGCAPGSDDQLSADRPVAQQQETGHERLVSEPDIREDEAPSVPEATPAEAIIVYFANDVTVRTAEGELEAAIGMTVDPGAVVSVGEDSFAEVQIGRQSRIMIDADSTVLIKDYVTTGTTSETRVRLNSGSLLARLDREFGSGRFAVESRSAVAGVRGTQFSATVEPDGSLSVIVAEGEVYVRPAVPAVDDLIPSSPEERSAFNALSTALEQTAVSVLEEQRVEVAPAQSPAIAERVESLLGARSLANLAQSRDELEATERSLSELAEGSDSAGRVESALPAEVARVSRLEEATSVTPGEALVSLSVAPEIDGATVAFGNSRPVQGPASRLYPRGTTLTVTVAAAGYETRSFQISLSDDTGRLLTVPMTRTETEPTEQSAIPEADTEADPEPEAEPENSSVVVEEPNLVSVQITVDPPSASILVDDEPVGSGSVVVEVPAGELLRVEAVADGYTSERRRVTPTDGGSNNLEIALAPVVVTRSIPVEVSPADAQVSVVGQRGARIGRRLSLEVGRDYEITAERDGFEQETLQVRVTEDEPQRISIALQPVPVLWRTQVADSSIVREFAADDRGVVWTTSGGVIGATNHDGSSVWQHQTANRPNENSRPVLSGDTVYFTGASEFVTIDRIDGRVISREPASGPAAHIFGRSVASVPDGIIYPDNSGFRLISPGGESAFAVPGGTTMTPLVIGNRAYIVSNEGVLYGFELESKEVILELATPAVQPVATAPVASGTTVYFAGRRGTLVAVDVAAGSLRWTAEMAAGPFTEPEVTPSGVYVFAGDSIYGFSLDGTPLFSPRPNATSPPQVEGQVIFFGQSDGSLVAVDARDGTMIGQLNVGSRVATRPLVRGMSVIVGTEDGELLAVNRYALGLE